MTNKNQRRAPQSACVCASLSSNTACAFPPTGTPTFNYVYDRFGNRWQQNSPAGSIYTSNLTFTGNATNNNNRMDLYSYDSAGNLLNDNVHQYFYDAENRLIQVDGTLPYCTSNGASGSAATACYYYDADGKRVHRTGYTNDTCDNTGKRDYLFDLEGRVIVENNVNGTACDVQVYAGGRHFGRQGGGAFFYHSDWLGTVRKIVSDQFLLNSAVQTCTSLPFGDGLTCNSNYSNVWHFTGKERDYESNLDFFGARFDSSSLGRFMSADPLLNSGNPIHPQTWNRYAYALGNPLSVLDPTGLYNLVNTCDIADMQCNAEYIVNAGRLKDAVSNLQGSLKNVKDLKKKARLQDSLKAFGTENDGNRVYVSFAALSKGAPADANAEAVPTRDASGNITRLDVTFNTAGYKDDSFGSAVEKQAVDVAHEGTHLSDESDPRWPSLYDFQREYRGYETSRWARQALRGTNPSWELVDDQQLTLYLISVRDQNGKQMYPEFKPHDPWGKNP